MLKTGDKVARSSELGTVVGTVSVGEPPSGFEGAWPGEPPRRMAVIHWPGRKKLSVEPVESLVTPESGF